MDLLSKFFSIKDHSETHRIMYIMGLNLKFPKAEYAKKKKENLFYYYKKNNIDITTIPPAKGQTRDIQSNQNRIHLFPNCHKLHTM